MPRWGVPGNFPNMMLKSFRREVKMHSVWASITGREKVQTVDFFFFFFRAPPIAYRGSQARGLIGAVATSLHHRHSNTRSESCLRPIPQLTVKPDP